VLPYHHRRRHPTREVVQRWQEEGDHENAVANLLVDRGTGVVEEVMASCTDLAGAVEDHPCGVSGAHRTDLLHAF
jgi:hypothetical protein